ncbi:MAG: hypothetical protein PHH26_06925 [Candidatus Thermoplasmatota archaeon]|nr:hypothetical protein [Candidatus Thermoplasmatota archaeon]
MVKKVYKLNSVGVWSVAKVEALIMAGIGLLAGIIYAFVGTTMVSMMGVSRVGAGFGFLAIILFPLLYAAIGLVAGVVIALLYNLAARFVGGIEMEME